MIDHVGIQVSDMDASKAFYSAALEPLGYTVIADFGMAAGLGRDGKPDFWISQAPPDAQINAVHVALLADRKTVDAFHAAALAAGGRDNGAPGVRPQYHPNYYGAFVLDPSGHNVEVVCHDPA
jgi:catechol 2,3-dioxygenase-like lactoylglutathione lyase family enzyme